MLKATMRHALVDTGLDRAVRAIAGGPGAILMFHRLGDRADAGRFCATAGLATSPAAFERFIDTLQQEGYDLVTAAEAARRLAAPAKGKRFAALTFDDGYRDNLELLLPILARRRARATVYVTTGFVDRRVGLWWFGVERALAENDRVQIRLPTGPRWFPAATEAEKVDSYEQIQFRFLRFSPAETAVAVEGLKRDHGIDCLDYTDQLVMNWDQVRALERSGLVEIGGHGITHNALAAMTEAEARQDIAGGRDRLAAMLGQAPASFAYPFGTRLTVTPRVYGLAAAAGYASAVTTQARPLQAEDALHPHALPRIGLGGGDDWRALRIRLSGMTADRTPHAA